MKRLSEQIAPHFHKHFLNKTKVHQIDSGGRGSTKTSKNALKIAWHMLNDRDCNVVAIRRHKNTLRNSIFAELKKAFARLGAFENIHYTATLSPMQIKLKSGNSIYFGGLDDHEKLKGMVADVNIENDHSVENFLEDIVPNADKESQIKIVWLSEITEITEEDDILQVIATFSRGKKDYFFVLYEYNPPKNKFHWINKWADQMSQRKDCIYTHSDYTTVPRDWLGDIFISEADKLKNNDYDRYCHIYLGHVTGLEGLIYNYDLISIIDDMKDEKFIKSFNLSIDSGHQTSATTILALGITNKRRIGLIDTYYYSPNNKTVKKAPSELSEDIWQFKSTISNQYNIYCNDITIDCAEGAIRNQYYKMYNERLTPVIKQNKESMIDKVQDFLAKNKFFVLNIPNNQMFLIEHKNYEWEENSVESGKPIPNKKEKKLKEKYYNTHSKSYSYFYADHTCDALQYDVIMHLREYGLK